MFIKGFVQYNLWKPRVVMLPTLSWLVALEVVFMTTSSVTSDDKVGIMTTLGFKFGVSDTDNEILI